MTLSAKPFVACQFSVEGNSMTKKTFTLGAVAYAPKVVTIWEGFREYFLRHEFNFDYILFSNYETQVEALLGGTIDAAWNSPLAHLRSQRMARAQGINLGIGPMRDSDQDLSSVLEGGDEDADYGFDPNVY